MASPKKIFIKESFKSLNSLLKHSKTLILPRIRMLIEIKKNEKIGISKRNLSELIGVNHNSIQTWRTNYLKGGIELLCSHKKRGTRKSVFNKEEHLTIEKKLKNPKNNLRGYTELLTWIEQEFNKEVKYNTLLKYCIRHFKSKVKVARKSHVKKDEKVVKSFKKTLHISVDK